LLDGVSMRALPLWKSSHNYQRVERVAVPAVTTPFIVAGLGGYYNLHKLNSPVGTTDSTTEAKLVAADDQHWGYMTLTVDAQQISGMVTLAPNPAESEPIQADSFSYPAAAQYLPTGATVTL
jgi:hypothetical protein